MASISANELNYLILRYLKESGFLHSAFNFGYEAGLNKSPIDDNLVPPGTLVKIVVKAVEYIRREAKEIKENTNLEQEFFAFLTPMELLTKDVPEMEKIVADRKKNQQFVGALDKEKHVKDKERKDQEKPDGQGFIRLRKGLKRKGKPPLAPKRY